MTDYFVVFVGSIGVLITTYAFFFEKVDRYEERIRNQIIDEVESSKRVDEEKFRKWIRKWRKSSRPVSNLNKSVLFGGVLILSSLVGWIGDIFSLQTEPYTDWAVVVSGGLFASQLIFVLYWHIKARKTRTTR